MLQLEQLKEQIAKEIGFPKEVLEEIENKSKTYYFNGGAIFVLNNEAHIHIVEEYQNKIFLKGIIKKVLRDYFDSGKTKLFTYVEKQNYKAAKFVLQIGFIPISSENETYNIFSLDKKDYENVWCK